MPSNSKLERAERNAVTDHYETLGVPRNADAATIKRAYRRRSKEAHPDRPGGDARAMVAVNRAYDTLSDPEKRARYDRHGEDRPPPPSLEQMARTVIMQVFMQNLDQVDDYTDLIKIVREQIQNNKREIPGVIEQGKQKVLKLKRTRKRLKYRGKDGDHGNFIDELLRQQIALLEEQVAKVKERIAVGEKALELLAQFEYEAEQRPMAPTGGGGFFFVEFGGTR